MAPLKNASSVATHSLHPLMQTSSPAYPTQLTSPSTASLSAGAPPIFQSTQVVCFCVCVRAPYVIYNCMDLRIALPVVSANFRLLILANALNLKFRHAELADNR